MVRRSSINGYPSLLIANVLCVVNYVDGAKCSMMFCANNPLKHMQMFDIRNHREQF